jgi:hypothetical protein
LGHTSDEYVDLFQFLLEKGADPNIVASPTDGNYGVEGTTLDMFITELVNSGSPLIAELPNLTIFKRLTVAGSEFSRPLHLRTEPTEKYTSFREEARYFAYFEDQIDSKYSKGRSILCHINSKKSASSAYSFR